MAEPQSFANIKKVEYKGPDSKDPLSFRFYDPDKIVNGKTMKEHLRFSIAAWHTVTGTGADPFGPGNTSYEWDNLEKKEQMEARQVAVCKFAQALSAPYFCFHGRDLFVDDKDFNKQEDLYNEQADKLVTIMSDHDVKLGWGTENLFSPDFYAQGALNANNAWVAARAMAEIGLMGRITIKLGGVSYVLWGGRVGYRSLAINSMEKELGNMRNVYRALVDYFAAKLKSLQMLEEPKGKEPTAHQYARDVATTLNFLRSCGPKVYNAFKMNVEGNHADLAALTLEHELYTARINDGKIGGIDANSGVVHMGWDADRYHENFVDAVLGWRQVDLQGGLGKAVINHDAKARRESTTVEEKLRGHIMAMDLWAKALLIVEEMKKDGTLAKLKADRYKSYEETDIGKLIKDGTITIDSATEFSRTRPATDIDSGNYQEIMWHLHRFITPK